MGHWLVDPDESGQTVHLGSFAPELASLIFNSLCRWAAVNAPSKGTFQLSGTTKDHRFGY